MHENWAERIDIFEIAKRQFFTPNPLIKFGNLGKILVKSNSKVNFYSKTPFFVTSNPWSNLESTLCKYWKFQNMWNLIVTFGTIMRYFNLTLHLCNSKLSLPTASAFWYVESHNVWRRLVRLSWNSEWGPWLLLYVWIGV